MKGKLMFVLILFAGSVQSHALSVINSKHDLSAGSATTGPKATDNRISCLFCHSVHKPASLAPLWNRADSEVEFTFYSSNYLNNYLGMQEPTMSDLNASKTKLCLSCHDGVTALGNLFNIAPNTLQMTGTMGETKVIGSDLSNDHPVLYDVKPGAGPPTAPGTNPEIALPPEGDPVKVYGPTNRVECVSCHDPHNNEFGKFLTKSNSDAALCTSCHQKTNYISSAHRTSNAVYNEAGKDPTTVGELSCMGCHKVHGASSSQAYLLRDSEENTCYTCHGSPSLIGAKDIKGLYAKASRHPTEDKTDVHVNPERNASNLGLGNRHAECWDCHNPHQAQTGVHETPGNKIGRSLLGGWGVEPVYGAANSWEPATSFVRQEFTETDTYKEYQLCFKCHSFYAYGSIPPAGSTDQGIEFNPNNRSAHPVRNSTSEQAGSASPNELTVAQMSAPWNTGSNLGHQAMTCSDCHASDITSDPAGPHGSASQSMLKGPRRYWPKNASGALWTLADIKDNSNNWSSNLFCVNCHPLVQNGNLISDPHKEHEDKEEEWGNRGLACIVCHVVNPHGSKRGRLIGYEGDAAPYNFNGAGEYEKLRLKGFKKANAPDTYRKESCFSSATGCHKHDTNDGGYDP